MQPKLVGFNTASGKHCCNSMGKRDVGDRNQVSIPQAVSTVATRKECAMDIQTVQRFNTASGKHCCNLKVLVSKVRRKAVSIPQAVSTVATCLLRSDVPILRFKVSIPQAVSTVATAISLIVLTLYIIKFQYRKR